VIRVLRGPLGGVAADAVVRSVRSDGEALSSAGRGLEIDGGEIVATRLHRLGDLPVGGAMMSPGGNLSAAFVIHVVIQSPDQPVSRDTVKLGLVNAVRRATDLGLESVAFSPVGAGAGNLDMEDAAAVLIDVLRDHIGQGDGPRDLIIVVANDYEEDIFLRCLEAEGSKRR
jgi:O-acetyl-ADP-ribose deacetylase (regulator of RNase III)